MIHARGIPRHKALVLSACDAARRFAPCRLNNKGRRDLWRPIGLRWRQRLKRPVNVSAGRAAAPSKFQWSPQFHFHLDMCLSHRAGSERSTGRLPEAGIPQTRVLPNQHWTTVRTAAVRLPSLRTFRLLNVIDASSPLSRHLRRRVPITQSIGPDAKQDSRPSVVHDPRSPVVLRIENRVRENKSREERAQRFSWPSRIRNRWLPASSMRWPTPGDDRPHLSREGRRLPSPSDFSETLTRQRRLRSSMDLAENGRSQVPAQSFRQLHRSQDNNRLPSQFKDPQELVWRREQRSPIALTGSGDHQERPESLDGSPTRSVPNREAVQAVIPTIERVASVQLSKLDPGLMDRLADDVIRRVEKRLRIERQRRGL